MAPRPASVLPVLLLVGAVAFAVGLAIGAWALAPQTAPAGRTVARPEAAAHGDPALAQRIDALAGEVAALRESFVRQSALASPPPDTSDADEGLSLALAALREASPSSARTPVSTPGLAPGLELDGLARRLTAIERLLTQQLERAPDNPPSFENLHIPSGAPQRDTLRTLKAERNVDDAGATAVRRRHLFLRYQDILDRYGRPDEVNVEKRYIEWVYSLRDPQDPSEPNRDMRQFDFHFVDGFVVEAH